MIVMRLMDTAIINGVRKLSEETEMRIHPSPNISFTAEFTFLSPLFWAIFSNNS